MEDLKALFKVRDEHFITHTTKILVEITDTLECVSLYLVNIDDNAAQGTIVWEDISIMEDIIIMMGTVEYHIGDTIIFGDEKIVVTDENADSLQQLVHMSVPIALVEEGDKDKIMDYLESTSNEFSSELGEFLVSEPQHETEFDLSELSDEQIQALKLSTAKGGH